MAVKPKVLLYSAAGGLIMGGCASFLIGDGWVAIVGATAWGAGCALKFALEERIF